MNYNIDRAIIESIVKNNKNIVDTVTDCLSEQKCVARNRSIPVFLQTVSSLIEENKNTREIKINKTYKKTTEVDVKEVQYKTYRIIRKQVKNQQECMHEYTIGRCLNKLKGEIDNFCYTFESDTPKSEFFIEHIEGKTLQTFREEHKKVGKDNTIYLLIFIQLYLALYVAYIRFGFVHNDLHDSNIIIYDFGTSRDVAYPLRFLNKTYTVNTRFFPMIIDYGMSQCYSITSNRIIAPVNFDGYDIGKNYCIPIRDVVRMTTSNMQQLLSLFKEDSDDILSFQTLINYTPPYDTSKFVGAENFSYCIMPSLNNARMWDEKMDINVNDKYERETLIEFYHTRYDQLINYLFKKITKRGEHYISIRDCVITDFKYHLHHFLENKEQPYTDILTKIFYCYCKSKSDEFLSNDISEREAKKIEKELSKFIKQNLTLSDIDSILNIQEKASMIRLKHRGMITKMFSLLKKQIDKYYVKLMKL
jgi:hypothetical protein